MEDLKNAFSRLDSKNLLLGTVVLAAMLAMITNMAACWRVYRHEPLRDAASRSLMAAGSSWFFAPGLAEPLPVAALKLASAAGADPDTAVRLQGLALFAAAAALAFFLLRGPLGAAAAAMAALFLSANPYMGFYAMVGSSNLFSLVFLLLFWHYFDGERGRRGAALAGLWGGLACLSRLDSAWVILAVAAFAWAVRRKDFNFREAGLALGLAALLTLPYLAWQKAHYGNALYAQELSLRRWANIDLYGYKPAEQAQQGPLSAPAFLLRKGPAGAVSAPLAGLGRALGYELPKVLYHKFLIVLVFLGVYSAFVFKKLRLLALLAAFLLPLLPLAGIAQVPASGGLELRYYLGALWALCALAGLGFQEILNWTEESLLRWAAAKAAPGGGRAKN